MVIHTNIQLFKTMLDDAGVVYKAMLADDEIHIVVRAVRGPANGGIDGMSTVFAFDHGGRLVCISTWGPANASGAMAA